MLVKVLPEETGVVVKVTRVSKAGDNHAVARLEGSGEGGPRRRYCREPCAQCPWRLDNPVGAFPAEAYRLSASTAYDGAFAVFGCHMSNTEQPRTCAGFLLAQGQHNVGVRLARAYGRLELDQVSSPVALYPTYRAMAIANGVAPDDPVLQPCRDDAQIVQAKGEGEDA